jgi:hypothetical protein
MYSQRADEGVVDRLADRRKPTELSIGDVEETVEVGDDVEEEESFQGMGLVTVM